MELRKFSQEAGKKSQHFPKLSSYINTFWDGKVPNPRFLKPRSQQSCREVLGLFWKPTANILEQTDAEETES